MALERANRWITRDSESAMFVTVFYSILAPETGLLCYTNAGHNPPLLIGAADGAVRELSTRDMALGVLEGASFHGVARLREAAVVNRGRGAGEILAAVIPALTAFAGGRPPFDDLMKMLPPLLGVGSPAASHCPSGVKTGAPTRLGSW